MASAAGFIEPGNKWLGSSEEKKSCLLTMCHYLEVASTVNNCQFLDPPMHFTTISELMFGTDNETRFEDRAACFLVASILFNEALYEETIAVLLDLKEEELLSLEKLAGSTAEEVQAVINKSDKTNRAGETIVDIAKAITNNHAGIVPSTRKDLNAVLIPDRVVTRVLREVYGDTQLVIPDIVCKVAVALDLFDWEDEFGGSKKIDVKFGQKVNPIHKDHLSKSLSTWVKAGDRRRFVEAMEKIGLCLEKSQRGFWGHYKGIADTHLPKQQRKLAIEMGETISQYLRNCKLKRAAKASDEATPAKKPRTRAAAAADNSSTSATAMTAE